MPPRLADGGGEGPVPMARDRAGTASGHGAGGCSQDPAWVRGCRKLFPILRVGFGPFRSLLGIGRVQILVLDLPCVQLGTFVRLGCCAHPGGHVLGTAGASVLRHGDAVLLSLLQTTPGRATEAFSQLLGAARFQTDAAPNPLTPRHRLAPASPPRGGRDRGDRGAAASPAPILHGAGCFQLLSPGAWLLPRTSVWQSRHPAKEPCVASRAGGAAAPLPRQR